MGCKSGKAAKSGRIAASGGRISSLSSQIGETAIPTPERLAKAGDEAEVVDRRRTVDGAVFQMMDGHPLLALLKRGHLEGPEFQAGMQFYSDWYASGHASSGVIDPAREVVDGGGNTDVSEWRLAAAKRYQKAVRALGLIVGHPVTCVVLNEEKLAAYGLRMSGQKSPKLAEIWARGVLQQGLKVLADHYGMVPRPGVQAGRMADGWRPGIL